MSGYCIALNIANLPLCNLCMVGFNRMHIHTAIGTRNIPVPKKEPVVALYLEGTK